MGGAPGRVLADILPDLGRPTKKETDMSKKNGKKTEALATTAVGAELVTGLAPDPATLVETITPDALRGVTIERVVTLDPGQMVRGKYLGMGAILEVHDPVTGEVRELATHRIEVRDGVVARIIESHQIARELPQYMGKRVRVMKLGQVSTRKGRRVNDFIIAPETA